MGKVFVVLFQDSVSFFRAGWSLWQKLDGTGVDEVKESYVVDLSKGGHNATLHSVEQCFPSRSQKHSRNAFEYKQYLPAMMSSPAQVFPSYLDWDC